MKQKLTPKQIELLKQKGPDWTIEEAARNLHLPVGTLRAEAVALKIVFKASENKGEFSLLTSIWGKLIFFVLINVLCYAAYYGFQNGEFLFDDHFIVKDQRVQSLSVLKNEYFLRYDGKTGQYHPSDIVLKYPTSRNIVWLAQNLVYNPQDKNNAELFHMLNYVFHLLNAFMIFLFMRTALIRTRRPMVDSAKTAEYLAAATALIFALHPMHAASVSYISSLSGVMEMFFALVMLLCFQQARKGGAPLSYLWYAGTFLALVLGLGCKESAVMLPLLLLIYLLFFDTLNFAEFKKKYGLVTVVYFVLILSGEIYAIRERKTPTLVGVDDQHVWSIVFNYLIQQPAVMAGYYLPRLFAPFTGWLSGDPNLSWSSSTVSLGFAFVVVGAIFWGAVKAFRTFPLITFGVVWFFGVMIPTTTLVPQNDLAMEHRIYLASLGIIMSAAWCGYYFAKKYKYQVYLSLGLAVLLAFFIYGTRQRNQVYQSDGTFWADVSAKNPENFRAWLNAGRYWSEGKRENSGDANYKIEDLERGVQCLDEASKRMTDKIDKEAHISFLLTRGAARRNLSRMLSLNKDKYSESDKKRDDGLSLRDYEKALELDNNNMTALNNIANINADEYASAVQAWRSGGSQGDFAPVDTLFQKTRDLFARVLKTSGDSAGLSFITLAKIEFTQASLLKSFPERAGIVLALLKESAAIMDKFEEARKKDSALQGEISYMPMFADACLQIGEPGKSWDILDRFVNAKKVQYYQTTGRQLDATQVEEEFKQDRNLAISYFQTRMNTAKALNQTEEFKKYERLLQPFLVFPRH